MTEQTTEAKVRAWLEATFPKVGPMPPTSMWTLEEGRNDGRYYQRHDDLEAIAPVVTRLVEAALTTATKHHWSSDHLLAFEDCYVPECYEVHVALAAVLGKEQAPHA